MPARQCFLGGGAVRAFRKPKLKGKRREDVRWVERTIVHVVTVVVWVKTNCMQMPFITGS